MAKITDLMELNVSSLTDDDLFHIIDTSESDDIVGSRKMRYSTLRESLSKQIGLNSLLSTWIDNKVLYLKYELKNGDEKTVSVSLSSIANIYEGDGTYLSIDDNTSKIHLNLENVSKNQTLSGYNVCEVSGQISAHDTTYSSGFGLSANGTEFGVDTGDIALKSHTHDYPVKSVNNKTGDVIVRTFEEFDASWKSSYATMDEFCESIYSTNPEAGRCFLGGIKQMDPMPPGFPSWGNIEVVVEVPVRGVYTIRATSTTHSPNSWFGLSEDKKFKGWKMVLNVECPEEDGTYTLKCTRNGDENIRLSWVKQS